MSAELYNVFVKLIIINGIEYCNILIIISLSSFLVSFTLSFVNNVALFFTIILLRYRYVAKPPRPAANTDTATPNLIGLLSTLIITKLPIIIIAILTSCSITWLSDGSLIYLCHWIYPLWILNIGTTSNANDTALITSVTSSSVFPPSKSPIIK